MLNALITSISKKVPLVHAVKAAARRFSYKMKVIGGDMNESCVASYFVDGFWKMPCQSELSFELVLEFCQKNNVGAIIPTRSGELEFWAEIKDKLVEHQIYVMVSGKESLKICIDKLIFSQYLITKGFNAIPSYESIERIDSVGYYVVKERYGSGSKGIGLKLTKAEAELHAKNLKNPIFQPFIEGKEYSIDVYVSKNGMAKGVVVRTRDVVENGESQVTTTCRHEELERTCTQIAEMIGLYGHVMFQALVDKRGKTYIIECNPRFGGASTLSISVGLDSFYWFLQESIGSNNTFSFVRSNIEKKQIRYPCDIVVDVNL